MDYKVLLWKYLNIVGNEESVTYWNRYVKADGTPKFPLTTEDIKALQEIEDMPMIEGMGR
jgi:hypothetical protein